MNCEPGRNYKESSHGPRKILSWHLPGLRSVTKPSAFWADSNRSQSQHFTGRHTKKHIQSHTEELVIRSKPKLGFSQVHA